MSSTWQHPRANCSRANWRHLGLAFVVVLSSTAVGQQSDTDSKQVDSAETDSDVLQGHSFHGEVFNEGPRQAAYLMGGTGDVVFPVTTANELAQQFINQGVGQLHGFWDFEAERSFRQVAAVDPDCAMAYWGAALANRRNTKRARGFIKEAVERKDEATRREQMYIEALDEFHRDGKPDKKARSQAYINALEEIIAEYPDDLEAKAFLALELYRFRKEVPVTSYFAVDSLIQQVLAVKPLHSAHHFRIHLWDQKRPEEALSSAERCGQGSPSIAHMWHMPGHIYSRLKRYNDAAWQQEASARVDHAHMMRDRVMPDRIHNFAHNNEWLIRNLIHVGRVRDAVDLAKNMIELPRHPDFNSLTKRGSTYYGRIRLREVLTKYELWDELVALSHSPYLDPTDDDARQLKRLRQLAMAHYRQGDIVAGDDVIDQLNSRLADLKQKQRGPESERKTGVKSELKTQTESQDLSDSTSGPKSDSESKEVSDDAKAAAEKPERDGSTADQSNDSTSDRPAAEPRGSARQGRRGRATAARALAAKIRSVEQTLRTAQGYRAVASGDYEKGLSLLDKGVEVDPLYLARVRQMAGQSERAIRDLERLVKTKKNEVLPLAHLADVLWQSGKKEKASKVLRQLRETSWSIDLQATPVFTRLAPIAAHAGLPEDWQTEEDTADDIGDRPQLARLGPFRWHPSPAPDWTLTDAENNVRTLSDYRGKPLLLIFYLGYGCLHCAEQLQAFGPAVTDFERQGISLLAVSSDDHAGLKMSIENYDGGPLPIPLVADPTLDVFKAYRAYDDFEGQPLHGTFLIDENGLVQWQDISYEPFMNHQFLLTEAVRLLRPTTSPKQPRASVDGG